MRFLVTPRLLWADDGKPKAGIIAAIVFACLAVACCFGYAIYRARRRYHSLDGGTTTTAIAYAPLNSNSNVIVTQVEPAAQGAVYVAPPVR